MSTSVRTHHLACVLVMVICVLSRTAHAQLLSPGPLANAHASIDGDGNCDKCHQSGQRVVDGLCLSCHKDLGAQIAATHGLHALQFKAKPCAECHVDHLGRGGKLIRWPGGAMEKLDHKLTGWSLDGSHQGVACLKCHSKTSPLGKPQFVGTKTACASCHKDVHNGRFGADCARCHSVADFKAFDRKAFDHKATQFPLTGKHTEVACDKCHVGTPPNWRPQFATCEACHKDPHGGQFRPKPCTSCHDTSSWQAAT